jgi:hypothetical protein
LVKIQAADPPETSIIAGEFMSKYCPEWLLSATVALVAQRYLASPLGLDLFAKKYAQILSERYLEIGPDLIEQTAEGFLRVLAEAEADDADAVLRSYAFNRITRMGNGEPRRIKGMFSSALDGTKTEEYGLDQMIKSFRPFFFLLRSKPAMAAPVSWSWKQIENGEWIVDLPDVEVTLLDSFDDLG